MSSAVQALTSPGKSRSAMAAQMAADGIRVVGRVVGASDGALAVARNANDILDEADAAVCRLPGRRP